MPDVDIDFFDRDNTLKLFKHTPASMIKNGKSEKHKTGVYFHAVPTHPVTGHSTLDYNIAEDRGYFKLDFLNVNIYDKVKDVISKAFKAIKNFLVSSAVNFAKFLNLEPEISFTNEIRW